MGRTALFDQFRRTIRIAHFCEQMRLPTPAGIEMYRDLEGQAAARRLTRRELLGAGGRLLAAGALASLVPRRLVAAPAPAGTVGIVGAGLAGLTCGRELVRAGATVTLYEAASRAGGRCFSLRDFFPGQVAEQGGEFIDNLHKTMLGYSKEFGLTREDVVKVPGEVFYFFHGQQVPESVVVDEYRALVPAMRADLRTLSGEPTADNHTPADVALDTTNLRAYLASRGAGPVITDAVIATYMAEYGLEPEEQSCLNFLLFIHADRRSKFTPFGIFSDERWHIVEGNDQVAQGLADSLSGRIRLGHQLMRVRKVPDGRIELTFQAGSRTVTAAYDQVVLATPFTTLREVELDTSLGLPPWKVEAIRLLGYGTNAKMMLGFRGPFWFDLGSNGASYSDLRNHQCTWETNPSRAIVGSRAILTDYSSGRRGERLDPDRTQAEAERFLRDLELVYRGAAAAVMRDRRGRIIAHLMHWPSYPLTKGSYTCYLPGQFTSIAGNEGKSIDNLHFAGEHANSFYEWQGFMEGAALSGIDAAKAVLGKGKRAALPGSLRTRRAAAS